MHGSRALLIVAWLTASAASQAEPVARLLAELKADGAACRCTALAGLAKMTATPAVLEAVALALGDASPQVRRDAVDALLALRPDLATVRDQLLSIVEVRDQTRIGMASFGIAPQVRLDASRLLNALHSDPPQTRAWGVRELCRQQTGDHTEEILALATDPAPEVRAAVAGNVGALGWTDAIRSVVERALKDPAAAVRRSAATTLGGHEEEAAVAALRGSIQDPDEAVRVAVVRSLGRCGRPAAATAATDLTASVRDHQGRVRAAALEALAQLQVADARAVKETIRCLDDQDRTVVTGALHAVAVQARAASAAMPRLRSLVHDENDEVRLAALDAIWTVAEETRRGEAVLLLVEALLDGARQVRPAARQRLEQFVDGWQ